LKPVELADLLDVGGDILDSVMTKSNLVDSKKRAIAIKCSAMSLHSINSGCPHPFMGIESIDFVLVRQELAVYSK
jgi:hypothetical protein